MTWFLLTWAALSAHGIISVFEPTGFKLRLPDGWSERERVKVWKPPADAKRTLEMLASAEMEDGRVTGAYIKVPSPDSFCTLEVVVASPMPPFDEAAAERLGMEWGEGMKRTIRGFSLMETGFFEAGEYPAVRLTGRWDVGGRRYETRQYLLTDAAASYKLVFFYPASEAEGWRAEADAIVKGVEAGPPARPSSPMRRYTFVMGAAALAFVLFWLAHRFLGKRGGTAAAAALLCLAAAQGGTALAESVPGSLLSVKPPPGYEAFDAEETADMLDHEYEGFFADEIRPWVVLLTPSEEEEGVPGSDWFFWGFYPLRCAGGERSPEEFKREFLAFNRYEGVRDLSLGKLERKGKTIYEYLFLLKVPSGEEIPNLALGLPRRFGYMVFEARESKGGLDANREAFLDSLAGVRIREEDKLLPAGGASARGWLLPVVIAVFALAAAASAVRSLRRRREGGGEA